MDDRIINDELQAAYALNLCTVSVSQIIDYDDLQILEQEYDAILNNLNLQNMPDDDALLNILTQLLDTITFFRLSEGDKKMIDKAYQQKMKNAIWSAAPNIGMILATGNPVAMAVSLASQVGIGYMNYRKTKASNNLEYEEQIWKLQRAAMEQFNGLRRELFDTAWRLAKRYKFEDKYRLTEKQIRQYNEILMDADAIRRFQRMEAIKDEFIAYPQFWYFFGNTANEIARDESLALTNDTSSYYREQAYKSFERYWETAQFNLLREDQIASACALEFVDLLVERGEDIALISEYIDKAEQFSGKACDILQLCAIANLRIGALEKAHTQLKYLVNENYNTSMNVQLLSGVLIGLYNSNKESALAHQCRSEYEILSRRADQKMYLIPWHEDNEDTSEEFIEGQKAILAGKFDFVVNELLTRRSLQMNKLIPVPDDEWNYDDFYFSDKNTAKRIADVKRAFSIGMNRSNYLAKMQSVLFSSAVIDSTNSLLEKLYSFEFIDKPAMLEIAENKLKECKEEVNSLQEKIQSEKFGSRDFELIQKYTTASFFDELVAEARREFTGFVSGIKDMKDISSIESSLYSFCEKEHLPEPDAYIYSAKIEQKIDGPNYLVPYSVLGEDAAEDLHERGRKNKLEKAIQEFDADLLDKKVVRIHKKSSYGFNKYFETVQGSYIPEAYRKDALAIIDDPVLRNDVDLILTYDGVLCVRANGVFETTTYESVLRNENRRALYIPIVNSTHEYTFPTKNLDEQSLEALLELFKKLNMIQIGESI